MALRDGIVRQDKAWIIACAAANLDPGEARQAEAMVLDRAGRLTPGGLRAAIARAVMEVAPGKARKRREVAAGQDRTIRPNPRSPGPQPVRCWPGSPAGST